MLSVRRPQRGRSRPAIRRLTPRLSATRADQMIECVFLSRCMSPLMVFNEHILVRILIPRKPNHLRSRDRFQ